mmetsp:Transcript_7716/g.16455  ORF Transcript_7716/g.16455 Transcript_7716/m.16455 type:complete len:227 (+) Transcript_7716:422-1102(+)
MATRWCPWRTWRVPTWTTTTAWPSPSHHPRGPPARGPRRTPRTCTSGREPWSYGAICPSSATRTGSTGRGGGRRSDDGGVTRRTSRCCRGRPRTPWWCTGPGGPQRWRRATGWRGRARRRTALAGAAGCRAARRRSTTWASQPTRCQGMRRQHTPRPTRRRPSVRRGLRPCMPLGSQARAALSPLATPGVRGRRVTLSRPTWPCSTSRAQVAGSISTRIFCNGRGG